jgi:hypothetical protein
LIGPSNREVRTAFVQSPQVQQGLTGDVSETNTTHPGHGGSSEADVPGMGRQLLSNTNLELKNTKYH